MKYCDPGSIKNLSYKIIIIYCFIAIDISCIMKSVCALLFRSVTVALITTENLQNT